jgi:hypothetical protein
MNSDRWDIVIRGARIFDAVAFADLVIFEA